MGLIDWWMMLAQLAPGLASFAGQSQPLSTLARAAAGIAPERPFPAFAAQTFTRVVQAPRSCACRSSATSHQTSRSSGMSLAYLFDVAFSQDGRQLATASGETVRVWDAPHDEPMVEGPAQ